MKQTLSISQMFTFGVAVFGIGMMDYAITVFLLFYYSDVLLLGTMLAGTAYFIGKIWDAVTDPFMGYMSDHTRSRYGRRRPYLFACALPLGISFFLLWTPVAGDSQIRLFIHLLFSSMLFYTFLTVFYIPYNALGAELTPDYNERTTLMGVRQGIFIFGLLVGAVVPALIVDRFETPRAGYATVGMLFGILTAITITYTAARVRESAEHQAAPTKLKLLDGLKEALSNRPFQILVITYILYGVATRIPSALLLFVAKYWLNLDPEKTVAILIAIYLICGVASTAMWVKLASRFGKKNTLISVLALFTIVSFCCLLLRPGGLMLFYAIMALAGASYGGLMVLSYSVLADVVDHDELTTSERREGMFFGVWDFAEKLSLAITMLLTGFVLNLIGYEADQVQSPRTILGMKLFFACVPAILYLIATMTFTKFPITRLKHEEIVKELALKKSAH